MLVPIDSLRAHPRNPRRGQLDAIVESLKLHGQYRPVIAQLDGTVVAGNHTLAAARALGWSEIAATLLDIDDEQAQRIMLVDNRTSDLAVYDDAELYALLDELARSDAALSGTGYDDDDLFELLQSLDSDALPALDDLDETSAPSDDESIAARTFDIFDRELVERTIFECVRAQGFPYPPRVPLHRAMIEINALAALPTTALPTSRLGLAVADGYHPHRFDISVTGKISPLACFNDERRLRICIARMLDEGHGFTDGTFRAAVSLTRGAMAASNFRPAFALSVLRKYGAESTTMLDCSTGFGGRLVGFLASHLHTYVGIDPSTKTDAANRVLIDELCPPSKRAGLICAPAEDVDVSQLPQCDVAFTSPPYFVKERYADEPTQSFVRYPTIDAWRDGFLAPLLRLQHAALVEGAANVINIADVTVGKTTHPLVEMTCELGTASGFDVEQIDELRLTHRYGANMPTEVTVEPVIVMRRK